MTKTSIALLLLTSPLAMSATEELQSYALRDTPDIANLNELNSDELNQLGISLVTRHAKILILNEKPHWQEGAIYYQEAEFDSWYFTNEPSVKDGVIGFTGNTSTLKYGSIVKAKPDIQFIPKNQVLSTYQFNNQTVQAAYKFSTSCDNSSNSLPAQGTLSISVNGKLLENFKGYDDEINPLFDYTANTKRTCEQFIIENLKDLTFGGITFVGDINQDGIVDFYSYTSSKRAYDYTLYVGGLIDGELQFKIFSGDSYAPL